MTNPFEKFDHFESRADWLGSTEVFTDLENGVKNKNNICLLGVQGSGKTSVLQCFFTAEYKKKMAQEHKIIICNADLSIQKDGDEICRYLADRIRSTAKRMLRHCQAEQELLEDLELEEADTPKALLQSIIELLGERRYLVVLVMDGFENFTSSTTVTMDHHEVLRSLIEANKLRCIVATDHDLSQDSLPASVKGSYLIQKFNLDISVGSLNEEEAKVYISRRQAEAPVQISDKMIDVLVKLSGGIPLLLEHAANCAYEHISANDGKVDGKELTAAIYERAKPFMHSWSKVLTQDQVAALKLLAQDSSNNEFKTHDFMQTPYEKAVKALVKRGLVIAPDEEYSLCVRANSLLYQRFCKENLMEEAAKQNQLAPTGLESILQQVEGKIEIKIDKMYAPGSVDSSKSYSGNATDQSKSISVENLQLNSGLSVRDVLQILGGEDLPMLEQGDSRVFFAQQLAAQMRKNIPDGSEPLLERGDYSEAEYEQRYDEAFDQISQKVVQDVEVDEENDVVVTPGQLQTLETRFSEARARCRTEMTDEFLEKQSDRCQFYMKLSVIVEDALDLPGIQLDDYSPHLVLYGKALEQSLRDNLYELFHNEEELSVHDTYAHEAIPDSEENFANKTAKDSRIGNYCFLIDDKKDYLADLCFQNGIQTERQPANRGAWERWWEQLRRDVNRARAKRNLADHADPEESPDRASLETMCRLLIGTPAKPGIMLRSAVGKALYEKLFPDGVPQAEGSANPASSQQPEAPSIPFAVKQALEGNECSMICDQIKTNGGMKGRVCQGGYLVNISPKQVQKYRDETDQADTDFVGKKFTVKIIERKTQEGKEFFSAQIVGEED